MKNDRMVGAASGVVAVVATLTLIYAGHVLPREVNVLLTIVCIACTLLALVSFGEVQQKRDDELRGEMGDLRPTSRATLSRVWFGFLAVLVLSVLAVIFLCDQIEERGQAQEARGIAFIVAFALLSLMLFRLPAWGLGFQSFLSVALSSFCFLLVYMLSKKYGAELN